MAAVAQSATFAGQLLVAKDELQDPRFVHSVVYIFHHDATGAMGLILNRPGTDDSSLIFHLIPSEAKLVTASD